MAGICQKMLAKFRQNWESILPNLPNLHWELANISQQLTRRLSTLCQKAWQIRNVGIGAVQKCGNIVDLKNCKMCIHFKNRFRYSRARAPHSFLEGTYTLQLPGVLIHSPDVQSNADEVWRCRVCVRQQVIWNEISWHVNLRKKSDVSFVQMRLFQSWWRTMGSRDSPMQVSERGSCR